MEQKILTWYHGAKTLRQFIEDTMEDAIINSVTPIMYYEASSNSLYIREALIICTVKTS